MTNLTKRNIRANFFHTFLPKKSKIALEMPLKQDLYAKTRKNVHRPQFSIYGKQAC